MRVINLVRGGIGVVTLLLCYSVFQQISIQPQVDEEFFFAESDPALRSDQAIAKRFGDQQQLLVVVRGDIASPSYLAHIADLSQRLRKVPGVHTVRSLSDGPGSFKEAAESPLWSRVLLPDTRTASNVLVFFRGNQIAETVVEVEEVARQSASMVYQSFLSGVPYVIEASRRELSKDVLRFSTASVVVFSLLLLVFFRSITGVLGAVLSCCCTCAATLFAMHLLGIPVGVLTANFVSICFIVCVSHVVFLQHNFHHTDSKHSRSEAVRASLRRTFPASLWATTTTAAGFATFLTVDAQPLREFGVTGLLAAALGLLSSYLIFPWFLSPSLWKFWGGEKNSTPPPAKDRDHLQTSISEVLVVVCLLAVAGICIPGVLALRTDASLLSYFDRKSEIYAGLAYADAAGGTSPLKIVVRSLSDKTLASSEGFERMWKLQESLEAHPAIGSVISLPIIMAEANEHPLSFLLTWNRIISILQKEKYGSIASNFITADRNQGLFLARMKEQYRERSREQTINDVRQIVRKSGLGLNEIGGAYSLQHQISVLVRRSLQTGLLQLVPLFFVLGLIAGRRIRVGFAVACSVAIVPIVMLGLLSYFDVPIDLASVPAASIAVALGVDQLFHLIAAVRRVQTEENQSASASWRHARLEMRAPILRSLMIVACGAGISSLSSFPPIRMFGWLVVFGTFLAGLTTLYLAPAIASLSFTSRRLNPPSDKRVPAPSLQN